MRLQQNQAGLLIVDVQEKLVPAMFEKERLVSNAIRLARGAGIFGLPVWVTEQYPQGLGPTLPEVRSAIPDFTALEKVVFSAWGADGLPGAIRGSQRRQILLGGIEAHVCVTQTCLDLLENDFEVFVVADAISSRTEANWHWGLERMKSSGAVVVSTEMVLFEWLAKAGTPEFKAVLSLVK